jgi:UDP-2,3-diacylglucosamine hydrolase
MRPILFISDLHLCAERPAITHLFTRFTEEVASGAAAVYILGDLFEYWLGDDQLDHDPLARNVAKQLATLAARETRIFFMHGNRDFLLSERFATESRVTLLPDPTTIDVDGQPVLLMHGDTLCTDDRAYQEFRRMVRGPAWQTEWLAKAYANRLELARALRSQSDVEKSMKAEAIMDVNPQAVEAAFVAHRCSVLIHGHTHRPAKHITSAGEVPRTRWVLTDWHEDGGVLVAGASGFEAHELSG